MVTNHDISGVKVAVLIADGFEQSEFDGPVKALQEAGAEVEVLALDEDGLEHIKGVNHTEPAEGTEGHKVIAEASVEDYDGLLIPGGLISPDTMRASDAHLNLVREFVESGKTTAAICHGPWLLADAGIAEGMTLTSWPNIHKDIERAGATWVDKEVVVDENVITSRKPDDIPAFSKALIEKLAKAKQENATKPMKGHAPREA